MSEKRLKVQNNTYLGFRFVLLDKNHSILKKKILKNKIAWYEYEVMNNEKKSPVHFEKKMYLKTGSQL